MSFTYSIWSQIAGVSLGKILSSATPAGTPLGLHRKRVVRSEMPSLWNSAWQNANTGALTRLFFPTVESALILSTSKFPFFLCSFISGHCGLNYFLFKIKRSPSPLCSCQSGEVEDAAHILFVCASHVVHRADLITSANEIKLSWPVSLDAFSQSKTLWSALIKFLSAIK